MAGYFEEMGWSELLDGERPDHLLHMARYMLDIGLHEEISTEWPILPPPASKESVKNLTEVCITEAQDDKNCPICLKVFKTGDKVKQMPCQHVYHSTCISIWLGRTNSCPSCRYELPTDSETYEAFKKEKKRAVQRKKELEVLHDSMFS